MISSQLTAWRERLHWTRLEAAARLGCSREALCRWETGKAAIPRYVELATIALANAYEQVQS